MRILVIFLIIILGTEIYGQSDSTERAILQKKLLNREISRLDYSFIIRKWDEKIEKDKYPELPFNSDEKIQYSYVMEFKELSKAKLFNRILEWLSIEHGIVPAYLYANPEDGKIICPNSVIIQVNTSGIYASVFTITEGKILIDFAKVGYQVTSGGYYSGESWIPERTVFSSLDKLFPIILKEISHWNYYINILTTMNEHFNNEIKELNDYITNYDIRYVF